MLDEVPITLEDEVITDVISRNDLNGSFGQYTNYRISRINIDRMKDLKKRFNIKSYDALISFFIHTIEEERYPAPTVEAVLGNNVPVILTGIPGVGKTTFLRDIVIPCAESPIFVLDPHDEYRGLKQVSLGAFFSLDFENERRKFRLVTNSNVDVSKSEADSIFRHLIMFQKQLYKWVIVVEEGHRFVRSTALRSLLAESRKHMRKMILVSHQPEPYRGLGLIYEVSPSAVETIPVVSHAKTCSI